MKLGDGWLKYFFQTYKQNTKKQRRGVSYYEALSLLKCSCGEVIHRRCWEHPRTVWRSSLSRCLSHIFPELPTRQNIVQGQTPVTDQGQKVIIYKKEVCQMKRISQINRRRGQIKRRGHIKIRGQIKRRRQIKIRGQKKGEVRGNVEKRD